MAPPQFKKKKSPTVANHIIIEAHALLWASPALCNSNNNPKSSFSRRVNRRSERLGNSPKVSVNPERNWDLNQRSVWHKHSHSKFRLEGTLQLLGCESNWLFRSVTYLLQRHFTSLCIYESGPITRRPEPSETQHILEANLIHLFILTKHGEWSCGCLYSSRGGVAGGQLRLDPGRLSGDCGIRLRPQ